MMFSAVAEIHCKLWRDLHATGPARAAQLLPGSLPATLPGKHTESQVGEIIIEVNAVYAVLTEN